MNILRKFFLGLILCDLSVAYATNDFAAQINVLNGRVVMAWNHGDSTGVQRAYGAIGSYGTDPTTWTTTELTDGQSFKFIRNPKLYANSNGDVLVVWERCQTDLTYAIFAAVLPVNSTTWVTQVISAPNTTAGIADFAASIDGSNLFVTWGAQTAGGGVVGIWGAMGTMSASPNWNTFQIQ